MWQSKPALVLLLLAVSTAATVGKPLLTKVTKGVASTALYTAPLSAGRPLVLDLSAPAITTPCSGQTTTVTLSANSTDGSNPLSPVSFAATATCAAAPSGAVGVAGLARSSASFPAQVASTQKVANSFALCLPSGGVGAAIFGGGPFFLAPPADRPAITTLLSDGVPLRQPFSGNPGYFVSATNGIAIGGTRVAVSGSGALVVGLSTTIPYAQLRSDVYRPFITAFDRAMGSSAKVAAVAPFELCYDSSKLSPTLSGYSVPQVDVMLEGGTNFTVVGGNSMAQVNSGTACFAFVQAGGGTGGAAPAVVIGGFQMENKLVVLDNDKKMLSFTPYLPARGFSCSNFNFTRAG
ncbi:chitinase CLP-like [Triticum dicoccoides]|uniref:chitinase CLP-like n=1 Tax=Triticum dicoccoides TaxID=85692 RepID=UPI000E7C9F27|nr:chitinase CLP-like [Triticum dicoccoides]